MNKYTINQFRKDFPNEDVCLDYIFKKRFPEVNGYYRVKGRKCYANSKGEQIHPLAGTIFHKSDTPLTNWLYAIYLFSQSKNGVSAKELERQLGVTYKCAWRIARSIRMLMGPDGKKLGGTVEADETYIGGRRRGGQGGKDKTPVIGVVERGGDVKAKVSQRQTHLILNHIRKNVRVGSSIMSDKFGVYKKTAMLGYQPQSVNHWRKEFVRGNVHTNTIEGFWSQLKRSLDGTYHAVSPKHLQKYVDEFSFRYNHRTSPIFQAMIERI